MCKGTIRASLIVSCVALAMLATTSVIAYCAGRSIDTELRFLTPGRAPTPEEADRVRAPHDRAERCDPDRGQHLPA
jgi:hypothetical protein